MPGIRRCQGLCLGKGTLLGFHGIWQGFLGSMRQTNREVTGFAFAEYDIPNSGFLRGKMALICLPSKNTLCSSLLAVVLAAGFAFSFSAQAHRLAVSSDPQLTVWAWERDEDLSYIDPTKVRVAYFAGNIYVRGSSVRFRPRTQKLKLPKNALVFPVFRIESIRTKNVSNEPHRSGSEELKRDENSNVPTIEAASFVAKTIAARMGKLQQTNLQQCDVQVRNIQQSNFQQRTFQQRNKHKHNLCSNTVQIDFDALEDERPFYKELLKNLRKELRTGTKISITSLASWLLADKWIERGSADEAVAMLFSIGPGKNDVLSVLKKRTLDTGSDIPVAIGISASEYMTNKVLFESGVQRKTDNLYIFSSRPWTEQRLRSITCEALAK